MVCIRDLGKKIGINEFYVTTLSVNFSLENVYSLGIVTHLAWLPNNRLLTISDNKVLRCWQWTGFDLQLKWTTHQSSFVVSGANFDTAKGLSESNRGILRGRGAKLATPETKLTEEKHATNVSKLDKPSQHSSLSIARQLTRRHSIYAPLPIAVVTPIQEAVWQDNELPIESEANARERSYAVTNDTISLVPPKTATQSITLTQFHIINIC
jgi:hypothetical protein